MRTQNLLREVYGTVLPFVNMQEELPYKLLADAVFVLHAAVVVFVIGGLVLIVAGNLWHWWWVNGLSFRLTHLAAIVVVIAEAWLDITCPLTSLEMWLRERARAATYSGGFIEYWLERVLYYDAPSWIFALCYSLFGVFVVATWFYFPPRSARLRRY